MLSAKYRRPSGAPRSDSSSQSPHRAAAEAKSAHVLELTNEFARRERFPADAVKNSMQL